MKKYLSYALLALTCLSCAYGVEDPLPSEEQKPVPVIVKHKSPPEPEVKVCQVKQEFEVKDCTVYYLICEDGSDEIAVSCSVLYYPIGHIDNTPRPVRPNEYP